jgi:hypothetical protein
MYALRLPRPRAGHGTTTRFTLRARPAAAAPDAAWIWARDAEGHRDGLLVWPARADVERVLGDAGDARRALAAVFESPDAALEVESVGCPAPHTRLLSVRLPVPGVVDDVSATVELRLGAPKRLVAWASVCRTWSAWMAPVHGVGDVGNMRGRRAALWTAVRDDGVVVAVLGAAGLGKGEEKFVAVEVGGDGEALVLCAKSDSEEAVGGRCLVSVGTNYGEAVAAVVLGLRDLLEVYEAPEGTSTAPWDQAWVNGLGYCTWNSLGQNLTEQKIVDAMESFDKAGIKSM